MSFFFFKQKTAYEVRISDWSSDVCSSGLPGDAGVPGAACLRQRRARRTRAGAVRRRAGAEAGRDRKSVVWGKRVSVRVDLGGRRIIKKKKERHNDNM